MAVRSLARIIHQGFVVAAVVQVGKKSMAAGYVLRAFKGVLGICMNLDFDVRAVLFEKTNAAFQRHVVTDVGGAIGIRQYKLLQLLLLYDNLSLSSKTGRLAAAGNQRLDSISSCEVR